jgi:hypothetical protein
MPPFMNKGKGGWNWRPPANTTWKPRDKTAVAFAAAEIPRRVERIGVCVYPSRWAFSTRGWPEKS